jgi:V/A-type H+/Na+-transporting ATPase subunit E
MADLATLLESEANAEIETILAEARSRADAIIQAAVEQAKATLEGRKRALEGELSAGQVRARSAAELESSALRLSASHGAAEKAFVNAANELRAFTKSGEYQGVLTKLIAEVKSALPDVAKLEVNPADINVAKQAAIAAGLTNVEVTPNADVETGVRASPSSGQTSVTNTLLGRLGRARDSLLSDVARVLTPSA